jgi:hypothetical protein
VSRFARAFFVIGVLVLSSCSGSAGSAPQSGALALDADIAGDWLASISARRSAGADGFQAQLTLEQVGVRVKGPFETAGTASGAPVGGELKGAVAGRELQFTLTQWSPCNGSFFGSARVSTNGLRMSGSYSGSDCGGTLRADFQARRVNGAGPAVPVSH